MSNPINYNINVQLNGANGVNAALNSRNVGLAQAVNSKSDSTLSVPTTGVQPTFPAITTPGVTVIYNSDPTNFVKFGPYISGAQKVWGILHPGQYMLFTPDPACQMSFTADTATVVLEILMLNL